MVKDSEFHEVGVDVNIKYVTHYCADQSVDGAFRMDAFVEESCVAAIYYQT